jgi:hypothetical protein
MTSYVLPFDSSGRTHEDFTVPAKKAVYLTRAEAVKKGTATVTDLLSLNTYTLPDGETMIRTNIAPGTQVSLAFMAKSNPEINSIMVEVITPR